MGIRAPRTTSSAAVPPPVVQGAHPNADGLATFDMQVQILIVEDHPLFREALQSAVHIAYPEATILEATTIELARKTLDQTQDINLLLLDLSLPGIRGFEGLIEVRAAYPRLPVLIVSAFEDPKIIQEAMNHGAAGFIPKSVKKPELAQAIRAVMSGMTYLPDGYVPPAKRRAPPRQPDLTARLQLLTPAQYRVLQMVRQGKLNKQIAFELSITETTVKAHVSEVLRKLGVASRTQAVIELAGLDFDNVLGPDRPQFGQGN